jgi:ribose transport system substrate-binding protein
LFAQGGSESKTSAKGASDIEVAVVLKTLASEYWNYVKAGCDAAAKDLGIIVHVVGPGSESDIEGQVAMIEQQLGAGCDAIVVAPNDASAASAALQSAIDAKIPVLSVDTNVGIAVRPVSSALRLDAAKQGGLWAAKQVGKGANAVIIYGQEATVHRTCVVKAIAPPAPKRNQHPRLAVRSEHYRRSDESHGGSSEFLPRQDRSCPLP